MKTLAFAIACSLALGTPAPAQPDVLAGAIAAGEVGERYDGYMAVVGSAPPQVTRQVNAINIRRRNLYIGLAQRRNVSPETVGMAAGCQLLTQLAAEEYYMLDDRRWRRRSAGQTVALPGYCG
jgi:uncharacterized protein YdbL (DUF1318 family)